MGYTVAQTMYEKIGGRPAIESVVVNLYERVLDDETLVEFFADTDIDRQRRHLVAFVAMALGGPQEYKAKMMQEAHAGHAIEESHFSSFVGHLSDSLTWAGVDEADVDTIIGVVAELNDQIVDR